jgi:hypothetical protein
LLKNIIKGLFGTIGCQVVSQATWDSLQRDLIQRRQELKNSLWISPVEIGRFLYLHELVCKTVGVEGDIVECGVGKGFSLALTALSVMVTQDSRNLWGFDSFEGFPEPTEEDRSPKDLQAGHYAVPMEVVQDLLARHLRSDHFIRTRITLVKGFFEEALPQAPVKKISLLNLDVDLYESYRFCLETLYPRLSPGGIVTFDEYVRESFNYPGAAKAINEFFADKQVEFLRDPYYGKYYVIKPE